MTLPVKAKCATDRRLIDIDHLDVQTQVSCVPRIVVASRDEFLWMSITTENVRRRPIEFDSLRHYHIRQLSVETGIPNNTYRHVANSYEVIQPPVVAFTL